ncbi:MAG TPA: hypothetical protein VJT80_08000 [Steroidobacteraceae bacterium]|nr:hypothetical protein [Steroidobacteraceae bacterium]
MQDYEKLGVFYLGREYDAATRAPGENLLLYDSRDLTTHAVCVGMTGSGKTGLCLSLLEEAGIDGIPAICIDPKGDLGNLLLTFPHLQAAEFLSWIDPGEAQRKGLSVEQYAAQTAENWKKGLAEWGQPPERIQKFRDAVDLAIYTPGSEAGLPLSVVRSFAAPPAELLQDTAALRERIATVVSGLLALLDRDANPINSRDHVLLSTIFEDAWRKGTGLDLASLIGAVQKPPFEKVGAFDLETFYPAKERLQLAMAVNNLIASPGFAAWLSGEPLDIQRLLFTAEGKPRISVISIAHLSDQERMFIVTLLLNEVIAWMRSQSGTSSLRAIVYMDEIYGYFPPTANPPSKQPMLTLLKQARAFGVGCVLATQNPVDLDYKGLANAGTWMIGRLQTERDKLRVLEGLESAVPGSDRAALDKMISSLTPRVFLMRNVHDDAPVLFQSRWALSYLRGPLTGVEISKLMAPLRSATKAAGASPSLPSPASGGGESRPGIPSDVAEYFLAATAAGESLLYKPMVMGTAKLHFVDAKLALDQWQTTAYLAPLSDDGQVLWDEAQILPDLKSRLSKAPAPSSTFAQLPAGALRTQTYAAWGKALSAHLFESARSEVLVADALKATSPPGMSEGDFRAQLTLAAREQRDAAVADLKRKYAPKLAAIEDQLRRGSDRIERERSQLSQQRMQSAFSIGASVLGALLGRRTLSAANVNRAASAARAATRIGRESGDVDRANEGLEVIQQRQRDLQQQFDADAAALETRFDASAVTLRKVPVSPRKSDIAVGEVALVWTPWRKGADGFPTPAS